MKPVGSALWRQFRVFQIFGANTGVGKTITSTILLRRLAKSGRAWYLKPVSTGLPDEADTRHLENHAQGAVTQNFYQFDSPVSPHLAARETASRANSQVPSDSVLLKLISEQIHDNARSGPGFMLVESAGGPNSPGPSGTLQAELYRPLRLPTIFVADWQLGGISTSISSFESLQIRGYDIEGVAVLQDSYYKNFEYFQSYFENLDIPVMAVPQPPPQGSGNDLAAMTEYYENIDRDDQSAVSHFTDTIIKRQDARYSRLEDAADEALQVIWWPFCQHQNLQPQSINTIDSAYGDYFQTVKNDVARGSTGSSQEPSATSLLQPTLDGSASWWTQGLGHANHTLTMAASQAAGRYGHVMFAEGINEPALSLATNLLQTVNNPRLKRVFYSDNGSTGMEVGVKMALKAACIRYDWDIAQNDIEIIGLQGSYHGDTLGTMDMSEPSVFNKQIHWYRGRGFWFECPSVTMRKGKWVVEKPRNVRADAGPDTEFDSLQQVFDQNRDSTEDAAMYEKYIVSTLENLTRDGKRHFGALVMEPVVLGAGGMVLVDPLFQRTLANVVRRSASLFAPATRAAGSESDTSSWAGLPVLADEVFTGLYRLGHASSSSLILVQPDISVHAKLLTGGLVPLCCTLASKSIFEAFLASGKPDALLHGHSYTAHPVGCAVANASLKILNNLDSQGAWDIFKQSWGSESASLSPSKAAGSEQPTRSNPRSSTAPQVWSVWSTEFLSKLSHSENRVDSVWALGSVLSISLKDDSGGGYASNAAKSLQQQLFAGDSSGWNIHSRVLGNVLYIMASQMSEEPHVRAWEQKVVAALDI